jgi:glycosyltransferase involved in cell wall biosynthesis
VTGSEAPPLSILLVIPALPPIGGGAEVHAARLACALRERGHSVTLLTMAGEQSQSAVRAPPPAFARRGFSLRVAWTILLGRSRFDIAHFLLAGRHTALGVLSSWLTGIPRVVMYGGSGTFADQEASREGRLALKADSSLADRLVALNEGMRESFKARGAPSERVVILPCEVDPEFFRPGDAGEREAARARFGIPADARVVTFVGRFVPEKEIATLLAAFRRLAALNPAAMLVLAGDGPDRAALSDLAGRLPAGRVVMTGRLAEPEVRDLLQASDVFSLVSSLEGIPCALVEAMAAGLPCVVSDIAGTREIVAQGITGLRVPLSDVEALAAALLGLLSDPERRARMGGEARRRALERYAPAIVAAAHERLYREIIEEKRRGRSRPGPGPRTRGRAF